jgi:hypothetical protein
MLRATKAAMVFSLLLCMDFRGRRDTRGGGGQGMALIVRCGGVR